MDHDLGKIWRDLGVWNCMIDVILLDEEQSYDSVMALTAERLAKMIFVTCESFFQTGIISDPD